jgi:catechol 2,3-dioxygenase-like lactoylglutathione lyase family enzyme
MQMITGTHVIIYTKDAKADRAFFRDVLGLRSVDAGQGWLIFALPPSEAAFHPADQNGAHEIYLMCDDLGEEIKSLQSRGVACSAVNEERWGSVTRVILPGGGKLGLYQPRHKTSLENDAKTVLRDAEKEEITELQAADPGNQGA